MAEIPGAATAHAATVQDVLAAAGADPGRGLDAAEVARRLARDGPNEVAGSPPETALARLVRQVRSPLVLLLVAAAAVAAAAWIAEGARGVPFDVVVIVVVVVANAVLGTVQEGRSARAAARLRALSVAPATVLRDGAVARVPSPQVALGDVLLLAEGDAVAADARLLAAEHLVVVEAALTGESAPVTKSADAVLAGSDLADRTSMVFAGTAVAAGSGRAVVTATGTHTRTGRVAALLATTRKPRTPMEEEVAAVGGTLARVVPVVALAVVLLMLATSPPDGLAGVVRVLLVGVSLAVAAVPEGLPAVVTLVLALAMTRMAARHAVVRRLAAVETLGSATVLCTDKTGTLTTGTMAVRAVEAAAGGPVAGDEVLVAALLTGDAHHARAGDTEVDVGDPVDVAVLVAARARGLDSRCGWNVEERLPFTAERRRAGAVCSRAGRPDGSGRGTVGRAVFVKGAPDTVAARCDLVRVGACDLPWDDRLRAAARAREADLTGRGLRTLAVASRDLPVGPWPQDVEQHLVLLGLVGLADPPRPGVAAAVRTARDAGLRVVMITGDHPRTAAAVAREVGILAGPRGAAPDRGTDGSTHGAAGEPDDGTGAEVVLGRRLDDEPPDALVARASVFARVEPEHKLRIVEALRRNGDVVAMTGDGVNDAPALQAADIGVAMGRSGTQVAREAADLVLTDDDFSTIVRAVEDGRSVYENITSFLRYLLSSNLAEILTMAVGAVLVATGVLAPLAGPVLVAAQILWINLLTDLAPALALGVEPGRPDAMRRPPRPRGQHMLDRATLRGVVGLAVVMAASALAAYGLLARHGEDVARTGAFTTLVLAQLVNVLVVRAGRGSALRRLPRNRWLLAAVTLSAALQVAAVHLPGLRSACRTVALSPAQWVLCAVLASAVLWVREAVLRVRKTVLRVREAALRVREAALRVRTATNGPRAGSAGRDVLRVARPCAPGDTPGPGPDRPAR